MDLKKEQLERTLLDALSALKEHARVFPDLPKHLSKVTVKSLYGRLDELQRQVENARQRLDEYEASD